MKKLLVLALAATLATLTMGSAPAMAAEEPPFTVEVREDRFEIRQYGPQVIAEVDVTGERSEAANRGFRPLADYIFGGNQPNAQIAMTAPVVQTRGGGQRIAMTAPVSQTEGPQGWRVRFVMPEGSRLEDMPNPNNPAVRLSSQPGRRMAVVRFSGLASERALTQAETRLTANLTARGEVPAGPVEYAFYDPPWTLPALRRNEVMVPLRPR
jgi:hypothetical protein